MLLFIQSHVLMAWCACSLFLLPIFSIYLAFGIEHSNELSKDEGIEATAENKSNSESIPLKKVLVEVTDSIVEEEEEEEEEEDGSVYIPSVAPATPHPFNTQSVQFMEIVSTISIAFQASKLAQLDHTPLYEEESAFEVISTGNELENLNHPMNAISNGEVSFFENESTKGKTSDEWNHPDAGEFHSLPSNPEVDIIGDGKEAIEEITADASTENMQNNETSISNLPSNGLQGVTLNKKKEKEINSNEIVFYSKNETNSDLHETNHGSNKSNNSEDIDIASPHDSEADNSKSEEKYPENDARLVSKKVGSKTPHDSINVAEEVASPATAESLNHVTLKTDDLNNVEGEKGDSKMLSFTEWKKQHDKEKVKEEDLAIEDSKTTPLKNKTVTKKEKKIKKNYASIDCGGKIVAANDEASNILSILKEDKDVYMLNPCNVKAWFIVELCDRIQVESLDFANFEMFSSTPEVFNVYAASRYPSREWQKVGIFHAKPEKQIQTYIFEEMFYAKYLKIEIKKYFGKEHYCPLSLLRVYGITEVEQFEDDDDIEHSNEDSNSPENNSMSEEQNNGGTTTKGGNIFEAAKNVVVDLVNGMAKKFSGQSISESNETSFGVEETKTPMVVTLINVDEPVLTEEDNATNSFILGNATRNSSWEMWYYYRYLKHACPIADFKTLNKDDGSNIRHTLVFPSNTTYENLINNITSQITKFEQSISFESRIPIIKQTTSISSSTSITPIENTIPLSEVSQNVQETMKIPSIRKIVPTATTSSLDAPGESTGNFLPTTDTIKTTSDDLHENNSLISVDPLPSNTSAGNVHPSPEKQIYDEDLVDVLEFKINETLKGGVVAEKITPNSNISNDNVDSNLIKNKTNNYIIDNGRNVTSNVKNQSTDKLLKDQSESADLHNPSENISAVLDASGIISSSFVVGISDAESAIGTDSLKSFSEIILSSDHLQQPELITQSIESQTISSLINLSEKSLSGYSLESSSFEKESQTANSKSASGISGSKESIIVKLNAKVKALQANLTMSMMYLDEMSERYRTAVEEVDERHKKKYLSLNTTLKMQQEMIKHQSEFIANLSKQMKELTFQLQNLTKSTEEQHQKIVETHATWVFLEIIIILIFILLCKRNPKPISELDPPKRRSSEPFLVKHDVNVHFKKPLLKKQISDPTFLASRENTTPLKIAPAAKKRQRKKSSSLTETEKKTARMPRTTISETAGLLFYAGKGLISGIAGAFSRTRDSTGKLSHQADALVDDVSNSMDFNRKSLRKAKSAELPPINEDDKMVEKNSFHLDLYSNRVCKKDRTEKVDR